MTVQQFPCKSCGAVIEFQPGTNHLECPYCGSTTDITPPTTTAAEDDKIEELDFKAHLTHMADKEDTYEVLTVKCDRCGAETTMEPNVTAGECAFCGTNIVMTTKSQRLIKPKALLPFKVTRQMADQSFRDWLKGLWFAPSDLAKQRRTDKSDLKGVYLPHWTYDTNTKTDYTGQRGEYYYVNETYRTTDSDGKSVTRTRRVRKTRWYSASGRVRNSFDDLIVVASRSLPHHYVAELEPWDLHALVPYNNQYLSGFRSESYSVELEQGFNMAKTQMQEPIQTTIKRDIGGDTQRIKSQRTSYHDITFKHILLPVWINAYRYNHDIYRFLVNARTGEIQGERPRSWIKIGLAVMLDLIVAILLALAAFSTTSDPEPALLFIGIAFMAGLGLIYFLAAEGHSRSEE